MCLSLTCRACHELKSRTHVDQDGGKEPSWNEEITLRVVDGDGAVVPGVIVSVMLRTVGVEGVITSHRVSVRALGAQAEVAARSPS